MLQTSRTPLAWSQRHHAPTATLRTAFVPRGQRLTAREREAARLLAEGWTDREIAATLTISRKTVSNHVSRILDKVGARTRTGAASLLIRGGMS